MLGTFQGRLQEVGKLRRVVPEGPKATKEAVSQTDSKATRVCMVCSKRVGEYACARCHSGSYCSKDCQETD